MSISWDYGLHLTKCMHSLTEQFCVLNDPLRSFWMLQHKLLAEGKPVGRVHVQSLPDPARWEV